ncbi:UNVERIFIED_ORG: hypothetical protein J2X79_003714 [Arthrobacter globiformis]|nr:hypothetical protein [Arthrobacter globiformis]
MAQVSKRAGSKKVGSLQRRIAAGKAEPISDRERAQLEELRQVYIRRFGKEPVARSASKSSG